MYRLTQRLRYRPSRQHLGRHPDRCREGPQYQKSTLVSNQTFRVLTWNVANLTRGSRLHDLDHIIRVSAADLAIVTETELGQDDMAVLPGFHMFRSSPGLNGKSRLLVYAKDSIQITFLKATPMEIWLTVNLPTTSLTIAGVYRQWHGDEQAALANFFDNCASAAKTSSKVLVLKEISILM